MPKDTRLTKLYNKFNRDLFNSELPHSRTHQFSLTVSNRMTRTLGLVSWTLNPSKPTNRLTISGKLMNFRMDGTPDIELVKTLLHEMCHLLMNVRDGHASAGHGHRWKNAWLTIGKAFDEFYNPPFGSMEAHAKYQSNVRYSNHTENYNRAIAAETGKHKWSIGCPTCGFTMNCNRMGRIIKKACIYDGVVRHGNNCFHKLNAVKNY